MLLLHWIPALKRLNKKLIIISLNDHNKTSEQMNNFSKCFANEHLAMSVSKMIFELTLSKNHFY